MSQPERLAGLLRSAEVSGESGAALGALIGAELAATRAFWLGADLRLMGAGALADAYEAVLRAQAAWVTLVYKRISNFAPPVSYTHLTLPTILLV